METNGLPGGIFSGIGSGILGLEMPLHPQPQQQPQNPQSVQNPHNLHHHHQQNPQMVAYSHHETDHSQHLKQGCPLGSKTKQATTPSDEDEPGFTLDDGGGAAVDSKRKVSLWQRMKWTDSMVRLLIMAVYYIGDDAGSEGGNDGKKKGVGGGLLQKKGKWKSVSRAMMEKGFHVSPQQCEDKFNDLNKRYKRVNDILGRETACKVVENQSLLVSMDLSPKMKEEVRKLLNSKHLFFREMCAYHNSCGHGSTANLSLEVATETSQIQHQQAQQQRCLHSSNNAQIGGNSGRTETEVLKLAKVGSEEEEDDDEDDESDNDEDDDDEEAMDGLGQEDYDENDEKSSRKRPRKGAVSMSLSPLMQQLSSEVVNVIQDGSKSAWEKKHWMKMRLKQMEEQQVSYQCQAFELEKQRLKWVKFSGKKEREMEKSKLENERRRLESERMVLILRQKELELLEMVDLQHHNQPQQHSSNKRGDPSSITG